VYICAAGVDAWTVRSATTVRSAVAGAAAAAPPAAVAAAWILSDRGRGICRGDQYSRVYNLSANEPPRAAAGDVGWIDQLSRSSHYRREKCRHEPLQLQTLPALTYLNFGQQELEALPEALTTMTSLRVTAAPDDNADVIPSLVVLMQS
jgi:hypothetical protein